MKKALWGLGIALGLIGLAYYPLALSQDIKPKDCFFLSSLHYTAKGMEYWYSKEKGGLELVTGVPYEKLNCQNCHVAGCDVCHKQETIKKDCKLQSYSTKVSKNQDRCLPCHGREAAMIRINHSAKQEDIHVQKGLGCLDCHSGREMHGDGQVYDSHKQPGAMDTQCENCHDTIKKTEAHTVHGDKLDCKACHIRHVVSCTNCHFDHFLEKGERKAVPVSGWVFLMNYKNKVSSASMQTFVAQGNKTFLIFAPHMSHAIMKEGRRCEGCHGTETMKQAQKGEIKLTWMEGEKMGNLKGVIPVVDKTNYQCAYLDLKNNKWVPLDNPAKPLRQYVAYGQPLSQEQLDKLTQKQEAPPPEMKPVR